jgi:hypothetical protein
LKTNYLDIKSSRYGGVLPMLKKLRDFKIPELISQCLGERVPQAKYSYESVILSFMMTTYCKGFKILNVEQVKEDLQVIPEMVVPSHDTIGRMLKRLATESQTIIERNPKNPKESPKKYVLNENTKLNDLLIKGAKKVKLLRAGVSYTLDIDATTLESEVADAKMTYKRFRGFTPMVCMINQVPVYISLRSGNANPHYKKLDCIIKCLELLKANNINIGRVRIDGAGYKNEILDYLDSKNIKFVIGASWSQRTFNVIDDSTDWEISRLQTSNHVWDAEMTSKTFSLATSKKKYRMVVARIKKEDRKTVNGKKTKWHLKDGYYYKYVITNDYDAKPNEIFKEYNDRGAIEKNFDYLKNDFGWRVLPFSKLNQNLVYMIITAFASNVYQGLLAFCSKNIEQIENTFRLPRFRNLFIEATLFYIAGAPTFLGKPVFEKIA